MLAGVPGAVLGAQLWHMAVAGSCRTQIADVATQRGRHLGEILAAALRPGDELRR